MRPFQFSIPHNSRNRISFEISCDDCDESVCNFPSVSLLSEANAFPASLDGWLDDRTSLIGVKVTKIEISGGGTITPCQSLLVWALLVNFWKFWGKTNVGLQFKGKRSLWNEPRALPRNVNIRPTIAANWTRASAAATSSNLLSHRSERFTFAINTNNNKIETPKNNLRGPVRAPCRVRSLPRTSLYLPSPLRRAGRCCKRSRVQFFFSTKGPLLLPACPYRPSTRSGRF
jgi:hypothetical protein